VTICCGFAAPLTHRNVSSRIDWPVTSMMANYSTREPAAAKLLLPEVNQYTVYQKKEATWCLIITLANKILCVHTTKIWFTYHLQCVTTLPCEIRKSKKMLPNFHVERDDQWLTKIYCEILCDLPQKYCTTVMILLKYVYNTWSIA